MYSNVYLYTHIQHEAIHGFFIFLGSIWNEGSQNGSQDLTYLSQYICRRLSVVI